MVYAVCIYIDLQDTVFLAYTVSIRIIFNMRKLNTITSKTSETFLSCCMLHAAFSCLGIGLSLSISTAKSRRHFASIFVLKYYKYSNKRGVGEEQRENVTFLLFLVLKCCSAYSDPRASPILWSTCQKQWRHVPQNRCIPYLSTWKLRFA